MVMNPRNEVYSRLRRQNLIARACLPLPRPVILGKTDGDVLQLRAEQMPQKCFGKQECLALSGKCATALRNHTFVFV